MKPYFPLALFFLCVCGFIHSSCKKEPIVQTIYIDTLITGNIVPNYTGVPTSSIQLYVNKLYVDLLGREPLPAELTTSINVLIENDLSINSRKDIIGNLIADTSFYHRLFDITSNDFINGATIQQIIQRQNFFYFVAQLDSINGQTQNLPFIYAEIQRLEEVKQSATQLSIHAISINDFYRRFLNNYFYDQVNMGTDNFVIASFEDLLKRAPTDAELSMSVSMVNGQPSNVMLQDGSSKNDFMNIIVHCDEFYEGLTRKIYLQSLLREPTSGEIFESVTMMKNNVPFQSLYVNLLSGYEYAGF